MTNIMTNQELLQRVHYDSSAIDKLIDQNKGLVLSLAKKFLNRGYDMEELVQLGNIGLFKAIKNYDPSKKNTFSTYAVPMILGEIKQFLRQDGPIKVSRNYKTLYSKILYTKEYIFKTYGYEPSINELSKLLNVSYDQIVVALDALTPPCHIHKTITNSKNETFLVDEILKPQNDPLDNVINKIFIDNVVSTLSAQDKKILYFKFIKDMTQSQIAKKLNTSQVFVSRQLKKILKLLSN